MEGEGVAAGNMLWGLIKLIREQIKLIKRNIDVLLRVSVGSRLFDVLYDEIYPV